MSPLHILMIITTTCLWGANFVATKMCVEGLPPFFQMALRFFLVAFPLIFFIPPPYGAWKSVFKFSFFLWSLQLSFITLGIKYGVPPGMFSLLIQTKAIVVVIFSCLFFKYPLQRQEILGLFISLTGVGIIAMTLISEKASVAYLYVIPAVLSVSYATLAFKNEASSSHPLSITVWAAAFALAPMALMSLLIEGTHEIIQSLKNAQAPVFFALFYTVVFSTLIATTFFVFLLRRYGPERIVPFNLLIPIFGITTSAFVYGEELTCSQIIAASMILGGLFLNQKGHHFLTGLFRRKPFPTVVSPIKGTGP